MKQTLTSMIFLFAFFGLFGQNNKSDHQATQKLESGQVWKYHTRKGEEASRVIILKVEDYGKRGKVVHVAIHGVNVKNSRAESGITHEVGHLPYDYDTILKSLTTLETTTNSLPDFMEGYLQWKEAFDNGKAGIFSITIKETIDFLEKTMNQ